MDIFLTPKELTARYRSLVSVSTLANWRSQGTGPEYVKIGGRVLYRIEAILKWETLRSIKQRIVYLITDLISMLTSGQVLIGMAEIVVI